MSLFDFCENIPPGYLGWILIAYTLDYLLFVESARYLDIVGVVKRGGKGRTIRQYRVQLDMLMSSTKSQADFH
jgi:phage anti-repressor protein